MRFEINYIIDYITFLHKVFFSSDVDIKFSYWQTLCHIWDKFRYEFSDVSSIFFRCNKALYNPNTIKR